MSRTSRGAGSRTSVKVLAVGCGWGACAGVIAALTLRLMTGLQHWLWQWSQARWYIFGLVLLGGGILALLRHRTGEGDLDSQLEENPKQFRWDQTAFLALSAITAVAFGGAIGPEAGLLAVVAQLSILVGGRIAASQEQERLLLETGSAAALAAIYGSPPAGAVYRDDSFTPSKLPGLMAGAVGFLAFLATMHLIGGDRHALHLPLAPRGDLAVTFLAIPAALLGAALAVGHTWLHRELERLMPRIGAPWLQTIVGSAGLAALLAAWPLLRFSGHAEMPVIADLVDGSAWLVLAGVAVLKVLATALSLASGWRGGEFFPLAFAGAAAGCLTVAVIPGVDVGTAMVAGMTAATVVVLGKPLVVMLIVAFMLPGGALGPVVVAVVIGVLAARLCPTRSSGHH